jgi:acyl carrier protein
MSMKSLEEQVAEILGRQEKVSRAACIRVVHRDRDVLVGIVCGDPHLAEIELRVRVTDELGEVELPLGVWMVHDLSDPASLVASGELEEALDQGWCCLYEPPQGSTEEKLTEIWEQALDRRQISVHDDFLDLGGDSMSAVHILAAVESTFGVDIDIREFMDAACIRGISEKIAARSGSGQLAQAAAMKRDRV